MATEKQELVVVSEKMSLTARDVKDQVQRIQEVMAAVMQDGEHYGKIPGCGPKPTLLKAGAEKLASTFRLAPDYPPADTMAIENDDFISYRVRCTLTHIATGQFVGAGVGACNSRERKYRNSSPWDIQNTIYKMACKRALVAAVLNATAASDIFTQDLEDMDAPVKAAPVKAVPTQAPAPAPKSASAEIMAHAATAATTCSFGKNKGRTWASMNTKQLEWYRDHFAEQLADNPTSKFVGEWQAALDGIKGVLAGSAEAVPEAEVEGEAIPF
ncbi:MAG TPA: hypothetical protein PLL10_00070 [Elusimicrobiales bacterium]|nr:hypothetical protein [Elusimicrobiales bacterium]